MSLINNLVLNLFSVCLVAILYAHSRKHENLELYQNKIFLMMMKVIAGLLVLDTFSRFDGQEHIFYPVLNHVGNFLIFAFNLVLPSLWILYTHNQVYHNEEQTKKLIKPLILLNSLNILFSIVSCFFGWLFYIDDMNIYHRGPLFFVPATATVLLLSISVLYVVDHRKKIESKYYQSLLFFAVPPLVSILAQSLFYGISIMLNSVVLSLLIVFLNIQNQNIYTDHLTGVNNRKRLDMYLNDKVHLGNGRRNFAAILIDVDDFKAINDTFGHAEGDNALQHTAEMLRGCLRNNDFIARYGGDEFFIVLDTSSKKTLEEIVSRIYKSLKKFNDSGKLGYSIQFSMGYDIFNTTSQMTVAEFQKNIDMKMYRTKQEGKHSSGLHGFSDSKNFSEPKNLHVS